MVGDPHRLVDEDRQLRVSKLVTVIWNKSGYSYRGRGRIVNLSRSSVTVVLLDRVGQGEGYPVGSKLTVPRVTDAARWSSHNCVRLLATAKGPEIAGFVG